MRHPNPHVPAMRTAGLAVGRAEELGLRNRVIFFLEDWVPYEQWGRYLLEADLGVSAHFDDLESRFAFRTRLLDCLWAGVPVVTTVGDTLGDLVERRGLGRGVAVGDTSGWVSALGSLLDDADAYAHARRAIAEVTQDYVWPNVVTPLRRLVHGQGAPVPRGRLAQSSGGWMLWRVRHAVADRGVAGAAARAAQLAGRRARRRAVP
jgi:glycosyltransferase involved in cell wall biosynthesis